MERGLRLALWTEHFERLLNTPNMKGHEYQETTIFISVRADLLDYSRFSYSGEQLNICGEDNGILIEKHKSDERSYTGGIE